MSSAIPALPVHITPPAAVPPTKASAAKALERPDDTPPRTSEHRAASALSASDIGYVDSLMGVAPPQAMEYIMLKTGVPMPANLGQDVDTTA